jgi:hypothetical protein
MTQGGKKLYEFSMSWVYNKVEEEFLEFYLYEVAWNFRSQLHVGENAVKQ